MTGFAKGIYFVEIKTEEGMVRKKIIKGQFFSTQSSQSKRSFTEMYSQ